MTFGASTAALPPSAGAVGAVSEHPVKTTMTPPRTRKRIGCDIVHLVSILWIVKDHRAAPGHARTTSAAPPLRQLGGRGGPSWRQAGIPCGVAEEQRGPGFAAPAFAGCAFVEAERALVKARHQECQAAPAWLGTMLSAASVNIDAEAEWLGAGEHFGRFPMNPERQACRMHGRKVKNVQDVQAKLAQIFARSFLP